MKTDALIAALAADTTLQPPVALQLGRTLLVAVAASLAAFFVFWGVRPDIWAALGSFALFKTLTPLVLSAAAAAYALALVHPGVTPVRQGAAVGGVIALAALAFLAALALHGRSGLVGALSTPQLLTCLLSIPALAVPLLAATFWALSSGAATRPRLTGALAGLQAGAGAAAIYSLYCDKDMLLFALPAYATGIASVTLVGAIVGGRCLKW